MHEVWPIGQLKDKALELAQTLSDMPAKAVRYVERIVDGREKTLTELIEAEKAVLENRATRLSEGMRAFLEKREPVFNQNKEPD